MIIYDKQLATKLRNIIKMAQYPIGFIVPSSSDETKHYVFFFNKHARDINSFQFFINKKDNTTYFKVISKDVEKKMTKEKFVKYIKGKLDIGLLNDCSQQQTEVTNLSDIDAKKAVDYFYWFSNRRLNDERFDSLCKKIFGIKFDLRNGCGFSELIKLDEKNGIYLLVQNYGGMGGFAAIVSGSQIQNFMTEYDKLVNETKPTYKQITEMLPQKPTVNKEDPKNPDEMLMEQAETKTQINTKEDYPTLSMEDFEESDPYSVHSM